MTYPHPAHTLFGTIIIASIVLADVKIDSQRISSRCCPHSRRKCCEEVIEKRQPLNCSMPLNELIASSDCIQEEMFGKKSLELAKIEDVECCRVFTNEAKDADGTCVATCVRALRSPSLRSIDTLKSIKSCRPDNKDYTAQKKSVTIIIQFRKSEALHPHVQEMRSFFQCFRRCQSFLRSRSSTSESFPYLAVCDLADRLEEGILYVGPEVEE